MHTVPPPTELLDEWLDPNSTTEGRYGHLLLEQLVPSDEKVRLGLTPYFESAHLDAMLLKLAIATGAAAIPKRNVRRCSLFTVPSLALRGGPPAAARSGLNRIAASATTNRKISDNRRLSVFDVAPSIISSPSSAENRCAPLRSSSTSRNRH